MPLVPRKSHRSGARFASFTPLGQKMLETGLGVQDLSYATGISYRVLSDYLAWRRPISRKHLVLFCAVFECEAEEFEPGCWWCGDRGCEGCEQGTEEDV